MYFAPREAATEQICPLCGHQLLIRRDCHTVFMYCPQCRKTFPLAQFIANADPKMEAFLENIYMDRF